MYRLFFIAKNNMKRQKGDMITFFILAFLATFLIFDAFSAIFGMGNVLEDKFQEVKGTEILLATFNKEAGSVSAEKAISEHPYIVDWEMTPVLRFDTDYKNAKEKDYEEFDFIAESFETEPKYMHLTFDRTGLSEKDILLPYYVKGRFPVGDTMELKLGDEIVSFRVAGYAEDPYMCSSLNISVFHVFMSEAMMKRLAKLDPKIVREGFMYKGKADTSLFPEGYNMRKLEEEVADVYKTTHAEYIRNHPDAESAPYLLLNWETMKSGCQILPLIIMAIVLIFALIILIVAVVIISFSIRNYIHRNMLNTGILEASGYTVREIRRALYVQILLDGGLGSLLGLVTGILTFGSFGNVVSGILGVTWNQPVNPFVAVGTVLGLLLLILLVAVWISRRYQKITVLEALRGGLGTHNYRKNRFSFEKSSLPVSLVLSLKDTFGNVGRNIAMVLITVIFAVAMTNGFGLKENFADDPDQMIRLTGTVVGGIQVDTDAGFKEDFARLPGVTKVRMYYTIEPKVIAGDRSEMINTEVVDDPEGTADLTVLEGRCPRHDNEVMMTAIAAEDLGVKVGDVVTINFAERKAEYMIVGLNQRMQNMGRTMVLTWEGAERIREKKMETAHYILSAEEGRTYEELKAKVEKLMQEKGVEATYADIDKLVREAVRGTSGAMTALCYVFFVVTLLIVIFVESLVIRAKIVREWRGMGISKALGVTSRGLIAEIMLSNLPAIALGTVIGAVLSRPAGVGFMKGILAMFGIKKIEYGISIPAILLSVGAILLVALITSGLQGLKVRKLNPVEMINEE